MSKLTDFFLNCRYLYLKGIGQIEVRHAACSDERGQAADGKAEHADPACIDRRMLWPTGDHVIRKRPRRRPCQALLVVTT